MRRVSIVPILVCLAAACSAGPLDEYAIESVGIVSAPRLEFLQARAGMKFLQVRFEFENRAGKPVTLKALDFSLKDTAGRLHPFSAQVLDMGQARGTAEAVVQPGQRLAGSVVFQVPKDSLPAVLIFRREIGGGLIVKLLSSG